MKEPELMIAWMDRKIWSAQTWLETFGKGTKKQRPDHDIAHREEDIENFLELRGAYVKAYEARKAQQGRAS